MRREPKIQFYSYNNKFNLQEVCIRYNWIMSYFNIFQLCGVMEKIEDNKEVILIDYFGNLEGWTKKIGEEFNFDEIGMN